MFCILLHKVYQRPMSALISHAKRNRSNGRKCIADGEQRAPKADSSGTRKTPVAKTLGSNLGYAQHIRRIPQCFTT